MNQRTVIDSDTGEVIDEPRAITKTEDQSAMTTMSAEIGQQIATARRFPRPRPFELAKRMEEYATLDEATAEECMYSVPRGGKPIEGPSARYAEIVQQTFGNNRASGAVMYVDRDQMRVYAEGVYLDLETNSATRVVVWRRVSSFDKRTGKERLWNEDMIQVAGAAATSIAKRNAILQGVPKAVWRPGYDSVRKVIMGDLKTLSQRRATALTEFQRFGVTAAQVLAILGVKAADEITLEHLVPLRGMLAGLRSGETTVEEVVRQTVEVDVPTAPARDVAPAREAKPKAAKAEATSTKAEATTETTKATSEKAETIKEPGPNDWTQARADEIFKRYEDKRKHAIEVLSQQALDHALEEALAMQGVPRGVAAAYQGDHEAASAKIVQALAKRKAAEEAASEAAKPATGASAGAPKIEVGDTAIDPTDPGVKMEVVAIAGDDVTCAWKLPNGKGVSSTYKASELQVVTHVAGATADAPKAAAGAHKPVDAIADALRKTKARAEVTAIVAADITPHRESFDPEDIKELDFIVERRMKLLQQ